MINLYFSPNSSYGPGLQAEYLNKISLSFDSVYGRYFHTHILALDLYLSIGFEFAVSFSANFEKFLQKIFGGLLVA